MSSWRSTWYPGIVNAMRGIRGDGDMGIDGVPMPLLLASDGIPMLSQLAPGIIAALKRLSRENKNPGMVARVDLLDSDYLLSGESAIDGALSGENGEGQLQVPIEAYVSGLGQPGAAWLRSVSRGGSVYAPYLNDSFWGTEEYELMSFARQAMTPWQAAIDAAALMLSNAAMASDMADEDATRVLLDSVRKVCTQLDILSENPPASNWDKLKGAARAAITETEQFAGKAAAQLSEEVGKAAGNVASGFFDQAGITSLIVAGLAVKIAIG